MFPRSVSIPSRTIGLLGGSFNPAHEGHIHLSEQALQRIGLDEVWWLVSPQNPLKSRTGMASFTDRFHYAQQLTQSKPFIHVSDIEQQNGLQYTADTLRFLHAHFRKYRFVWLMGADNLHQFHHWRNWQSIVQSTPIAVFDRSPFSFSALASLMPIRYRQHRVAAPLLPHMPTPCWSYCFMPRHAASASDIRKTLGNTP